MSRDNRTSSSSDSFDAELPTDTASSHPDSLKLNSLIVFDETIRDIDTCLQTYGAETKYVKMYSGLYEKRLGDMAAFVDTCKAHDTIPYVGGGMTESAIEKKRLYGYVSELQQHGIDTVEISNSYGDLRPRSCENEIKAMRRDFSHVLIEIGNKTDRHTPSLTEWQDDIQFALDNDPTNIILEGGGSGDIGIYDYRTKPKTLLINTLLQQAGPDAEKIIIETPYDFQLKYLMDELCGWKMHAGNIRIFDNIPARFAQHRRQAMQPENQELSESNRKQHDEFLAFVGQACDDINLEKEHLIMHPQYYALYARHIRNTDDWRNILKESAYNLKNNAEGDPEMRMESIDLSGLLRWMLRM